ncbi:MAG: hypothetical protein ABL962_01665 [Fimbriimonadaceae bacterium]
MRKWLYLFSLLIALMASGCAEPSGTPVANPGVDTVHELETDYGFASEEHLREHYSKHVAEFGSISQDEYLRRALSLRDASVGGTILQIIRADGVRSRFDQSSGDFIAFGQDLTILTFFRPNDGERYFKRQATRPR